MEDILVPLGLFGMVFGFPLLRREMIHRHLMQRLRLEQGEGPGAAFAQPNSGEGDEAAALALRLPEPHRLYALALLCRLHDTDVAGLDARAQFTLRQAQREYLPQTLRGYLNTTPAARAQLAAAGHSPEALLQSQLETIARGVEDVLAQDPSAANHVLTQGAFLREVFQAETPALITRT